MLLFETYGHHNVYPQKQSRLLRAPNFRRWLQDRIMVEASNDQQFVVRCNIYQNCRK